MTTNIPVTKMGHMAKPYIEVVGKMYSTRSSEMTCVITWQKISVNSTLTERK